MNENVLALISTGVKLALEFIEIAGQLEKEGIVVPELDQVKARLDELRKSPPLPEK